MGFASKGPPRGDAASPIDLAFPGGNDQDKTPNPTATQDKFQDPAAVAAARRDLRLEFLHECAGGISIHAALVQTFAEIGDPAGVCYALKRLFAHVKAAHPVYVELRDEAGQ
jgi:hypothetical protein